MARGIRRAVDGKTRGCVERAIAAFGDSAPGADLLRHIHEHLDAYMRGEGHHQERLPEPTVPGGVAMLDDGPAYYVGGALFVLSDIAAAAEKLAVDVIDCVR